MVNCGLLFRERKILPIYSPVMPSEINCTPANMKTETAKAAKPTGKLGFDNFSIIV